MPVEYEQLKFISKHIVCMQTDPKLRQTPKKHMIEIAIKLNEGFYFDIDIGLVFNGR